MAALYHALGTSRILGGLMARHGLVEPREGIGCRQCHSARLGAVVRRYRRSGQRREAW